MTVPALVDRHRSDHTASIPPPTTGPSGSERAERGAGEHRDILDAVTPRAASTVLVGRQIELAALLNGLTGVRGGEPTAVLLGGEAGVGKTRLVEEFARLAVADGGQLLVGHCLELGEEGLPFAPFAAALRAVLRRDGTAAFDGYEQEFGRLLPELAKPSGRRPVAAGDWSGPSSAGPDLISDTQRGYLFELVAGLFARLAVDRPLVLVIEDLHWADRSTRDLIAFLIRAERPARMLLVGTYRSDELHRGHPLRPFLAELDRVRGVERLELSRLDREGTAELLADLLGAEPTARTIDNIHDRAQGNPFFVEELAALDDPNGCPDLPDTLRDLLLGRVDRLPDSAQRVLRIAAAGGSRIGHDLLAEVADVPEVELEEALRAAVAAQLVVVDPDGGYEFRHALVREAVHEDLLPGEHGRLHARYAAAIEAQPQLVAAGRAPAETAHHWYAARDHPRALAAALVAAQAAGTRYAYAEQSRLLERVLELWEQVPDAAHRLGMDHLALLEETLCAVSTAGDYVRALTLVRAALAEVDSVAEPLRAARLLIQRTGLLRVLGKSDGTDELRQAYQLAAEGDDEAQRVELLAAIASYLARVDPVEGTRIVEAAMLTAERLGDPAILRGVRRAVAQVGSHRQLAEASLGDLRRTEEAACAAGDVPGRVGALVRISDLLFETGRYAESAQAAADGIASAHRVGISRSTGAYLFSNQAEALLALGRWDEADLLCGQAARLDLPGVLGLHWLQVRAGLRLARGHVQADELVARALGFLSRPYLEAQLRLPLQELRIEAALAAGDLAGAAGTASAILAGPIWQRPRYGWPAMVAAARAAAATADESLARRIATAAEELTARYPAERAHAAQLAATLAELTDTVHGQVDAMSGWRDAVAAWRADGQPYRLARALVALAEAAARAGDRAGAATAIEEAAVIATGLGAVPLAEQAAMLARRIGVRGPGRVGLELLTGREREVLRLVAEGHSNSRIAERLYISPKTASVHVSRIIAKLEVANRIEAAAVAHRHGLIDPV